MNVINAYGGTDLLGLYPTVRMCIKGVCVGSIISSIQPAEERLSPHTDPSDKFKLSKITLETVFFLTYNICGKASVILSLITTLIVYLGCSLLEGAKGFSFGKGRSIGKIDSYTYISERNLKIAKKVTTAVCKFLLIANLGIMLAREGGLIPIVALTIYLVTSSVRSIGYTPQIFSDPCYKFVNLPIFFDICNFLVFTGRAQLISLLFGIGHSVQIFWSMMTNDQEETKKKPKKNIIFRDFKPLG